MKSLKKLTLIVCVLLGLSATAQNKNTQMTQEQVKAELINGLATFVDAVRPFYDKNDSFEQFRRKLLNGKPGTNTLPTLPPEGVALLQTAYDYLKLGLTKSQIVKKGNYEPMGKAAIFVANRVENGSTNNDGIVDLFGGNKTTLENNPLVQNREGCKWWQLWCHVDQIFGQGVWAQIIALIIPIIFP